MERFLEMKGSDMYIYVPAELDHHNAERIRREADRILQSRRVQRILFDFSATEFMDSSGIGMIMGRYKAVHLSGGTVAAIHVNEQVRKLLMLSGIHKIITLYEDMPKDFGARWGRGKHGI